MTSSGRSRSAAPLSAMTAGTSRMGRSSQPQPCEHCSCIPATVRSSFATAAKVNLMGGQRPCDEAASRLRQLEITAIHWRSGQIRAIMSVLGKKLRFASSSLSIIRNKWAKPTPKKSPATSLSPHHLRATLLESLTALGQARKIEGGQFAASQLTILTANQRRNQRL